MTHQLFPPCFAPTIPNALAPARRADQGPSVLSHTPYIAQPPHDFLARPLLISTVSPLVVVYSAKAFSWHFLYDTLPASQGEGIVPSLMRP